jgi:leader peptidase (prepilin peptidase)/N-methyltransferase
MTTTLAAATAAAAGLLAAPYLAGMTITPAAVDAGRPGWWRPRPAPARRTAITAAVAIVLATLAGLGAGAHADWPAYVALALTGTVLALIDAERHRLPNAVLLAAGAGGATLLLAAAGVDDRWGDLGRAAVAAAAVFAVFYLAAFASPRSVGLGDVKLAAVLAGYLAWRSWATMVTGLALGFLVAGVVAAGLLVARRHDPLPLGPFLITAALIALALRP